MDTKSCLQAEMGLKLAMKVQLNSIKDSRSQRLNDLKWPEYCHCLEARTKDPKNLPPSNILEPQHEKAARMQRDTLVCIDAAGFKKSQPIKTEKLPVNSYFEKKVNACASSGLAQLLIIESSLKSVADPRNVRQKGFELPTYCQCYFDFIRHRAGDDFAKVMADGEVASLQSTEKSMSLMSIEREGIEHCVTAQIPFPNAKKSKKTFAKAPKGE